MKLTMNQIFLFWLAVFGLSCTQIVVKVAKKGDSSAERESVIGSNEDSTRQPRAIDFEYYLFNLDELRNVSGDDVYHRLSNNWRHIFRREFRNFRQIVFDSAKRPHSYQENMTGNLGGDECRLLEFTDFHTFEGHRFLELLLEASFLANIDATEVIKLNPGLLDQLDVIIHMILFELGMQADGESQVYINGSQTRIESGIIWRVDSEMPDPVEITELDDYGVRFRFVRTLQRSKSESFSLQVEFAKGLFEDRTIAPEYRLELQHRWLDREHQGDSLEIEARIWHGQDITYSRLITLEQTARFSQIYFFRDVMRYQLEGEEERGAVIDFAHVRKCAINQMQMIVPGVIGMVPEDAENLLKTLQLTVGKIEDTAAGTAETIVIRQQPSPGSKVAIGSPVDLVLGLWSDLEARALPENSAERSSSQPAIIEEQVSDELDLETDAVSVQSQ